MMLPSLPRLACRLALSLVALCLWTAHATAAPLVHIGKTKTAPSISGKGDDAIWNHAIAVSDFLIPGSSRPLQERTEVRFLWDEGHLYLQARLEESILLVASQQQSEIKAKAGKRDANVFNDDSFLIILRPNAGTTTYEWAINTQGIISDAKGDMSDLWKSRDLSWNPKVTSATSINDGFWIVEMAIPWSELGQSAPSAGQPWQAIIGRHAASRSESGSWTASHSGVHAPKEWGNLVFGEPITSIVSQLPATLQPGKNRIDLTLQPQSTPGDDPLLVMTKVTSGKKQPLRTRQKVSLKEKGATQLAHEFDLKEITGLAAFSWSLIDAATLQPLYQSPEIEMEVLSSSLKLHITTTDAWRLIVNDSVVASGPKATDDEVAIRLRSGANVLAIETQSGTARLRLDSSQLGDAPIRWKMHDAGTPGATAAKTDDGPWVTAPETDAGMLGREGSPMVLRHTILLQHTRIFPAPIPALYLAGNTVQHVSFTAFGLPGRRLHDWKTYLRVPDALEAIGATGYYGGRGEKPQFTLRTEKGIQIVESNAPLRERNMSDSPILNLFEVALQHHADDLKKGERVVPAMQHYSRANDATVSELVQNTPITLLPSIQGKAPKNLTWQLWISYFTTMDNPKLRDALVQTAKNAGFNELTGVRQADVASFGLNSMTLVNFKSYSLNLTPWLQENPQARLIKADGQPDNSLMCTTRFLETGWKQAGAPLLRQWWESRRVGTINYDYEYPPLTGPHSCFCQACLEAFRVAAKLPASTPLDGDLIHTQHMAAWVDFMARRVAQVFLLMKQSIHELPGKVKFEIYSGYQTPDNASRYGVDWRYVGELQAADRAGMGYGRSLTTLQESVKALNTIPVLFGELITPYMTKTLDFSRATQQANKANLLRRSIDATGGVLVYHTQNMDGRSWLAAAETSRLVAAYEPLFGNLRAETVPGQTEEEVALLRGEKQSLLCVMNTSRTEKNYQLTLPAELGRTKEFYSGKEAKPGETIRITLPAGEIAVYASH